MPPAPPVAELMQVPPADHNLDWLKAALQRAVQLELATIPPYLTAFWSIRTTPHPAAKALRTVFLEEMLHLGYACNMLCGLGGTPVLNDPAAQPVYPGGLPGIDTGDLKVALRGLSKDALAVFMEIEFPESPPVAGDAAAETTAAADSYPTIGAFYSAVAAAFERLDPFPLATDRQPDGPLGLAKLVTKEQVRDAIGTIKRQGEGATDSPADTGPSDLAHYYLFGELYHERRLRQNPATGKYAFDGDPVPMPEVWPVPPVPAGGYLKADVSEAVWSLLTEFDEAYRDTMNLLQAAWATPGPAGQEALEGAVSAMYALRGPAVQLMKKPIPSGVGNYAPCFRLA